MDEVDEVEKSVIWLKHVIWLFGTRCSAPEVTFPHSERPEMWTLGHRYRILLGYSQDGVILSRVFQGRTNTAVFEDFIEQLLCHCNPWPGPRCVLILDNASFHYSDKITQLCAAAGLRLIYLL